MARDFAYEFYNSRAWKQTRKAYKKYRRGLCEICLAKGLYTPCDIVHHKTELTPENISDPAVTLNWDNLQCVCRACHAEIHGNKLKRYEIDEYGRIFSSG